MNAIYTDSNGKYATAVFTVVVDWHATQRELEEKLACCFVRTLGDSAAFFGFNLTRDHAHFYLLKANENSVCARDFSSKFEKCGFTSVEVSPSAAVPGRSSSPHEGSSREGTKRLKSHARKSVKAVGSTL